LASRRIAIAAPTTAAARGELTSTSTPTGPNQVWAYDFVHDACANGQKLKCLTLIDEFTHESLAIDVAGSLRSGRVIEVLTRLISARGTPMFLRSDNGPEFVSHAILSWLAEAKIETALINPGKPWQNGDNERGFTCISARPQLQLLVNYETLHYGRAAMTDAAELVRRAHGMKSISDATIKP
jgi:transposase InsO family protein